MIPQPFKDLQKTQRSRLKAVNCKRSASQLQVPLVGETLKIYTNRAFDPLFFLSAGAKLLPPIKEVHILTWTIHEVGVLELEDVVESCQVGSIVLKTRPSSANWVRAILEDRGHKCLITKTRAKVILMETHQGTHLSIETQPHPDGEVHIVSSSPSRWGQLFTLFEEA